MTRENTAEIHVFDEDAKRAPQPERAAPAPEPAFGYSITASCGDRRQIVVQCFVGRDAPTILVNHYIDQAMAVIDRQQAKYDLDAEMEGFEKVGQTLRQAIDGVPIARHNEGRMLAELQVKLEAQRQAREETYREGYDEWSKRGGQGEYKPKGYRLNQLAAMDLEIAKTEDAVKARPNDEKQNRDQVFNSIRHFQDDLKKRRARVNHLHSLLGKEPLTEYAEQEAYQLPEG